MAQRRTARAAVLEGHEAVGVIEHVGPVAAERAGEGDVPPVHGVLVP